MFFKISVLKQAGSLIKKTPAQVFSCEYYKFSETLILKNIRERLLLVVVIPFKTYAEGILVPMLSFC